MKQFRKPSRPDPCWSPATAGLTLFIIFTLIRHTVATGPQTNLLNKGCSQYNAVNRANFFANLNATFSDLRSRLLGQGNHFATAEHSTSSDPVHAMAQCRDYMSVTDCVGCYDVAVTQIRNCSAANGARVIYDGCFISKKKRRCLFPIPICLSRVLNPWMLQQQNLPIQQMLSQR